jgi:type VII secretion protein EccE
LALSAVVAAAMAYPWQTNTDWWILGVAVAVLVAVLAWWRGQFATTTIGRRLAVWRRNRRDHSRGRSRPEPVSRTTVLLRVEDPAGVGLPLPLVAGYVERFGVRCDNVRVTSRSLSGTRATWIALTVDAVANLAALQARSAELPLRETAETAARRLADHLREIGLAAGIVEEADAPVAGTGHETYRGVHDQRGVVTAYELPIDDRILERLAEIWFHSAETWTTVEFAGTSARPTLAAVCAFRTAEAVRGVPVRGLVAQPGVQGPLLAAMNPKSGAPLGVSRTPLPPGLLQRVEWPVGSDAGLSRT